MAASRAEGRFTVVGETGSTDIVSFVDMFTSMKPTIYERDEPSS